MRLATACLRSDGHSLSVEGERREVDCEARTPTVAGQTPFAAEWEVMKVMIAAMFSSLHVGILGLNNVQPFFIFTKAMLEVDYLDVWSCSRRPKMRLQKKIKIL